MRRARRGEGGEIPGTPSARAPRRAARARRNEGTDGVEGTYRLGKGERGDLHAIVVRHDPVGESARGTRVHYWASECSTTSLHTPVASEPVVAPTVRAFSLPGMKVDSHVIAYSEDAT